MHEKRIIRIDRFPGNAEQQKSAGQDITARHMGNLLDALFSDDHRDDVEVTREEPNSIIHYGRPIFQRFAFAFDDDRDLDSELELVDSEENAAIGIDFRFTEGSILFDGTISLETFLFDDDGEDVILSQLAIVDMATMVGDATRMYTASVVFSIVSRGDQRFLSIDMNGEDVGAFDEINDEWADMNADSRVPRYLADIDLEPCLTWISEESGLSEEQISALRSDLQDVFESFAEQSDDFTDYN